MTKIQAVRKEYGETFRDVASGYAVLGYSRKYTAKLLKISPSYFAELCRRFHVNFDRKSYKPECKPPGHHKGKRIRQPQRYTDEELLAILSKYSSRISEEHFNNIQQKPCADTIIRRFGSWRKAKRLASGSKHKQQKPGTHISQRYKSDMQVSEMRKEACGDISAACNAEKIL